MTVLQVVAGVIWKEGLFLVARRTGCKYGSGLWEFPGGKIEPNETYEQALVRELKEELGIIVQEFTYWKNEEHNYDDYTVVLHFYHVTSYLKHPMLIEGHDALAWVSPEESKKFEFLTADAQILEELKYNYPNGFI